MQKNKPFFILRILLKQDKVITADSAFIFHGQVGQGGEDDYDSEYIGFDGSPDD